MESKTAISAGELYVMLDREFRLRQPRECKACYILLPFRIDRSGGTDSNWELVYPPPCEYGCAVIIEELVDGHATRYDLAPDPGED